MTREPRATVPTVPGPFTWRWRDDLRVDALVLGADGQIIAIVATEFPHVNAQAIVDSLNLSNRSRVWY